MAGAPDRLELRSVRALVGRRLALVRLGLLLERLGVALWPVAALIGAYAALALFGLGDGVLAPLQGPLFLALLLSCSFLLIRRLARMTLPDERMARRRLESDNRATHRPLDALFDSPAALAGGAALWRLHRQKVMGEARRLLPKAPHFSLVAEDPRALRALVLISLFIGLLYAGADAPERLRAAFSTPFALSAGPVSIDAWVTPPDYTGKSPIMLQLAGNGPEARSDPSGTIAVPAGSALTIRLSGGGATPVLKNGKRQRRFNASGEDIYDLEAPILESGDHNVRQSSRQRASWPLKVILDQPPVAGFAGAPSATERRSLKIRYTLFDDFGVTDARIAISAQGGSSSAISLPLGGAITNGEPKELTHYADLTAHRLAGDMVEAVIVANDAAGQSGSSEPLAFRLPERAFSHPVAKKLIAIRKDMFRFPGQAIRHAEDLDAIARDIGGYEGDFTVFAALRAAFWRLSSLRTGDSVDEVADLLWKTALRLEEGRLSLATQSLRDALEQFEQALDGAPEGMDAAADALQAMMQSFLQSLAQTQSGQSPMLNGAGQQATMIGGDMLSRMIEHMRDLAAAGDREGAMRMLRQLQDIMENASTTPAMSAEDYKRLQAMNESARQLQDLANRQRETLNDTGRQMLMNRQRQRQGIPQQGFESQAGQQSELSKTLQDLQNSLKDGGVPVPEGVGAAARGMRGAEAALSGNSGEAAIGNQVEAVRGLESASEDLRRQLERSLAAMPGSNGLDPLGRPTPGLMTRGYEIPDRMEQRRVEEILEDLRRRLEDPDLGESDRAYLRRLLRRF